MVTFEYRREERDISKNETKKLSNRYLNLFEHTHRTKKINNYSVFNKIQFWHFNYPFPTMTNFFLFFYFTNNLEIKYL